MNISANGKSVRLNRTQNQMLSDIVERIIKKNFINAISVLKNSLN
jgi:hypothetical protein